MRKPLIYSLGQLPDPQLNPNKRLHFYALAKAKREAKDMMIALVKQQGSPKEAYLKAHITITWIAKDKRRRDIDNLFASMKPYIDGLVFAEVIADDNADRVGYTLRYERGDKNDTIIEVTEIVV